MENLIKNKKYHLLPKYDKYKWKNGKIRSKSGSVDAIIFSKDKKFIIKFFRYKDQIKNILDIYKKLNYAKFLPKIIEYDTEKLYIIEENLIKKLPKNWKKQLKEIDKILKKKEIYHNDLQIEHLYKDDNGTLKLIDWGGSSNKNTPWGSSAKNISELSRRIKKKRLLNYFIGMIIFVIILSLIIFFLLKK